MARRWISSAQNGIKDVDVPLTELAHAWPYCFSLMPQSRHFSFLGFCGCQDKVIASMHLSRMAYASKLPLAKNKAKEAFQSGRPTICSHRTPGLDRPHQRRFQLHPRLAKKLCVTMRTCAQPRRVRLPRVRRAKTTWSTCM